MSLRKHGNMETVCRSMQFDFEVGGWLSHRLRLLLANVASHAGSLGIGGKVELQMWWQYRQSSCIREEVDALEVVVGSCNAAAVARDRLTRVAAVACGRQGSGSCRDRWWWPGGGGGGGSDETPGRLAHVAVHVDRWIMTLAGLHDFSAWLVVPKACCRLDPHHGGCQRNPGCCPDGGIKERECKPHQCPADSCGLRHERADCAGRCRTSS